MNIIIYLCGEITEYITNMKLRVLEICKQKKISQKELAERINMSAVGLSKAINGNPTKNTLEKIASELNVPITELFERPSTDVIACPNCGAKLEIKIRE
jgi:transcriptional regulator with XRE-family HTH domain